MNQYQRIGTFIIRVVGLVVCAVGLMGLIHILFLQVFGGDSSSIPEQRRIASAIWAAFGLLLLVLARRLGEFLGRGLE